MKDYKCPVLEIRISIYAQRCYFPWFLWNLNAFSTEKKKGCFWQEKLQWSGFCLMFFPWEVDTFIGNRTNGCHFPCKNHPKAGYSLKLVFHLLGYDNFSFSSVISNYFLIIMVMLLQFPLASGFKSFPFPFLFGG